MRTAAQVFAALFLAALVIAGSTLTFWLTLGFVFGTVGR